MSDKGTSNSSFSGYSLNDYEKNLRKQSFSPHQDLIDNYHYGYYIDHAKTVLEKGLIVNSLLWDIPTATKEAAGSERGTAGFLVYVSKSNLNNLKEP